MEKTLPLDTDSAETAELQAAIAQCLKKVDELRAKMRRSDAKIAAARKETLANLADIAEVLADLRAA